MIENPFFTIFEIFQYSGEEFSSSDFNILDLYGIVHQFSCPMTPKQSGFIERKHRHIVETSLTLLFHGHVPHSLLVNAFAMAVFLIN